MSEGPLQRLVLWFHCSLSRVDMSTPRSCGRSYDNRKWIRSISAARIAPPASRRDAGSVARTWVQRLRQDPEPWDHRARRRGTPRRRENQNVCPPTGGGPRHGPEHHRHAHTQRRRGGKGPLAPRNPTTAGAPHRPPDSTAPRPRAGGGRRLLRARGGQQRPPTTTASGARGRAGGGGRKLAHLGHLHGRRYRLRFDAGIRGKQARPRAGPIAGPMRPRPSRSTGDQSRRHERPAARWAEGGECCRGCARRGRGQLWRRSCAVSITASWIIAACILAM
jgi:hypothetical protein